MMTILSCITVDHDIGLVLLAATLCAFGMCVTARLYQYARSRPTHKATPWHLLTAFTAGISIWCTHFVAMLGYRPDAPVDFDLGLTVVSLMIAVLGCALGLLFASYIKMRAASLVGGALLGLAMAGMHYAGMVAYRVQGIVHWDTNYLITSIILVVVFSSLALLLGGKSKRWSEIQMAVLLTVGIISLHFTGMTAFNVSPLLISGDFVNPEALRMLAVAVAGTALLIVIGGFFSYAVENHVRLESIKELTAARNAAESASRAKSEFMSVLSHELRTPLTIIMGYASILGGMKELQAKAAAKDGGTIALQSDPIADQAELYGQKITISAKHLLTLINEILDYTGMELNDMKLSKSAFAVSDLLADVEDQFQGLAREKEIELTIKSDDIIAFADRKRCFQILINLVGNALKFSQADKVELRAQFTQTGFKIEVEDNGCGIREEDFEMIFQAFQQVETADHRAAGGTGLGLAICKKLTHAHGGDITVQSVVGTGTTFTVDMPEAALDQASEGTDSTERELEFKLAS
ncbi:MAG: ATPase [Sulfitobacter sp.]|nr:ATPase [Sulfitobacter sp.]